MLGELGTSSAYIESAGTVKVASWLGPRPKPSDRPLITAPQMQEFVGRGGLLKVMQEAKRFVTTRILPEVPIDGGDRSLRPALRFWACHFLPHLLFSRSQKPEAHGPHRREIT